MIKKEDDKEEKLWMKKKNKENNDEEGKCWGDYGIHCWWDLRSKQLSCVLVCRAQVFAWFSDHGNSIHKKNEYLRGTQRERL